LEKICWADCPQSFRNLGAFCLKPNSYWRGTGYSFWNKEMCEKENIQGCEICVLLMNPKCKKGFQNIGCCICSPNCTRGMIDLGLIFAKNSYKLDKREPLKSE